MPRREFFETARKRKSSADSYWQPTFAAYDLDAKFFADEQWTQDQLDSREESGRPALTFNQVKQPVLRQVNQLRQNKPAIKINPKDLGASAATAEALGGKIREREYVSQADYAREHAAKCAAIGGFGFYRICTDYAEQDTTGNLTAAVFEQDIFTRPILDPRAVLYDPKAGTTRPDFSDAMWCFVSTRMKWDDYRREYPKASLQDWDDKNADLGGWADEEEITVAEYFHIEVTKQTVLMLADGTIDLEKNIAEEARGENDANVTHRRQVEQRTVHIDKINGVEVLEAAIWPGYCIPIPAVVGDQVIVEGKRKLSGMIRSVRDPQMLLNAYMSGEAEAIGLSNRVPVMGPKGMFKSDRNWQNMHLKNPAFVEWDPVYDQNGQLIGAKPERLVGEAQIQALSQASLQMTDAIKRGMGYADDVLQPSKSDLSGVAIQRRSMQQDTANFHISDSLALAMWHEGNIYLDLIPKIHDTPKAWQIMSESGEMSTQFVTQADENGNVPMVAGHEADPHHRLDQGKYSVTVTVGPSYSTKIEEESDFLVQILGQDPQLTSAFLDLIFKMRGYPDLENRAKAILPPQVQAAANGQQQPSPEQQQLVAQNKALTAQMQAMQFERQAETQKMAMQFKGKVLDAVARIMAADLQAKSKEGISMMELRTEGVGRLMEMISEIELAPGPDQGPPGLHPTSPPQPSPGGAQQGAPGSMAA